MVLLTLCFGVVETYKLSAWLAQIQHHQFAYPHLHEYLGPSGRYSPVTRIPLIPFFDMQRFILKISQAVANHILELTLYKMMSSSHDFEDVKSALDHYTNWLIELVSALRRIYLYIQCLIVWGTIVQFRSCFT